MKPALKDSTIEHMKDAGDLTAATIGVGAWLAFLPDLAALLTVVWGFIRIYEWARVAIFKKPPRNGMNT